MDYVTNFGPIDAIQRPPRLKHSSSNEVHDAPKQIELAECSSHSDHQNQSRSVFALSLSLSLSLSLNVSLMNNIQIVFY